MTLLLITYYFVVHLCVINFLLQTLKKYKNTHFKVKMEIHFNPSWKYVTLLSVDRCPVSNGSFYYIACLMSCWNSEISMYVSESQTWVYGKGDGKHEKIPCQAHSLVSLDSSISLAIQQYGGKNS